MEQHDEWQLQHRYIQLEAMAELTPSENTEPLQLPPRAARTMTIQWSDPAIFHHVDGRDQRFTSRRGLIASVDSDRATNARDGLTSNG